MYVRRSDVIELAKKMVDDIEKLPSVCPNDICWCESCGYQFLYASDYPCNDCQNGNKYITKGEYNEIFGK